MDPRLKQSLSGAGAGMTLAFLVVLKLVSESSGIRGSLPVFLAGITLGALMGWELRPVTNTSAFAYPVGTIEAFLLAGLWLTGNATFMTTITLTAATVGILYFIAPLGLVDVLFTPVTYFGGMLTALMVLGSVESLWRTQGALLGITMSGILGAVFAFFVVMLRFLVNVSKKVGTGGKP